MFLAASRVKQLSVAQQNKCKSIKSSSKFSFLQIMFYNLTFLAMDQYSIPKGSEITRSRCGCGMRGCLPVRGIQYYPLMEVQGVIQVTSPPEHDRKQSEKTATFFLFPSRLAQTHRIVNQADQKPLG